ncbi:MAG: O-antigen ligase family protein, partial [Terriglobales bacterium]
SAWVGTAAAIPLLAIMMKQSRRFFLYATMVLSLFLASIPILGLGDFIANNKARQDESAQSHQEVISSGLQFAADHPFGAGNEKLRPGLTEVNHIGAFETTYPQLAAEYGIAAALLFVGFLFSALCSVWREQTRLRYAALGILVGISLVMVFTLPLSDRRLACWALFPIGLAVRSAISQETSLSPSPARKLA